MLHNIFTKSLRDRRRSLIWWNVGLVALSLLMMLFYPTIREQREQFERLLESYPKALLALFGVAEFGGSLFSPAGYLKAELFGMFVPLIFLILGIGFGARAIAGEEERGTLELLLANPIPRRRIVLEKFLALAATLGMVGLIFWLSLWIGSRLVAMEIGGWELASGVVSAVLLGLEFGALALALGCSTGKVGLSMGVSAAVGVAGFFLNGLAPLASWLKPYQKLSPFYHYIGYEPLEQGLNLGFAALMLAIALLLLGISLVTFERRDIRV